MLFDLFIGWALLHPKTRTAALVPYFAFHLTNMQLYSLGVFPSVCCAMAILFFGTGFPFACCGGRGKGDDFVRSNECVYPAGDPATTEPERFPGLPATAPSPPDLHVGGCCAGSRRAKVVSAAVPAAATAPAAATESTTASPPRFRHRLVIAYVLFFGAAELGLPYTHSITKGYNSWTQGLYGYSWDMMIHSFHHQHLKVEVKAKGQAESLFLRPEIFAKGSSSRWSSHPDMLKQYAVCAKHHLHMMAGMADTAVHLDVWMSMNNRFQQRLVDPRVDLASVEWSPFKENDWIMPCLYDADDKRESLEAIHDAYRVEKKRIVFVSDFPGMELESHINGTNIKSVHLTPMEGTIEIAIQGKAPIQAQVGQNYTLPLDKTHLVRTQGTTPSQFMYVYTDRIQSQKAALKLLSDTRKGKRTTPDPCRPVTFDLPTMQYVPEEEKMGGGAWRKGGGGGGTFFEH
jgi:vitamin K-dependent gamma-carboxylase